MSLIITRLLLPSKLFHTSFMIHIHKNTILSPYNAEDVRHVYMFRMYTFALCKLLNAFFHLNVVAVNEAQRF